jgi:hypothetical protein
MAGRGISHQKVDRAEGAPEHAVLRNHSNDQCRLAEASSAGRTGMTATATIAPARPQHLQALSRANQVRLARAELKRRVACGEITASDVILESPWEAESMTVADLLMSQRRWGLTRCRKVLAQIPVSETKTLGTLTDRQRRALSVVLMSVGACARHADVDTFVAPAAAVV